MTRTEVEYLRAGLEKIATFKPRGVRIEQQAMLLREQARIELADSMTREAIRTNDPDVLAEITALWADYCDGGLDMAALAQELGEVLAAVVAPPEAET